MANSFLDRTNKSGDLSGTWTFTNASTAVSGSGGNAQTLGLGAGDYVKPDTTDEWYRIASVGGEDSITLDYNFVQATQTSVTANYADVSTNDGSGTSLAFVHINQYTTDMARTAGDILYMRRGQTHLHEAINISFDEAGSLASGYIKIMGDDGTGWSGETGYSQPFIEFNGSVRNIYRPKAWWHFDDFEIHDSHAGYGNLEGYGASYLKLTNFKSTDTNSGWGNWFVWANYCYAENCTFSEGPRGITLYTSDNHNKFVNCTFDNMTYGMSFQSHWGYANEFIECKFGPTSGNSSGDIYVSAVTSGMNKFIGCTFDSTTFLVNESYINYWETDFIFIDTNDVKDSQLRYLNGFNIQRESTVVRTEGASTSIKCTPFDSVNDNVIGCIPYLYETWIYNAGVEATYTIYMKAGGTWTTLPTSSEVYIEAAYYDQSGDAGKATVISNDAFADETNWTAYDVTCTPVAVGMVRLRVYCKKYEAGKFLYVDPLPVVS